MFQLQKPGHLKKDCPMLKNKTTNEKFNHTADVAEGTSYENA